MERAERGISNNYGYQMRKSFAVTFVVKSFRLTILLFQSIVSEHGCSLKGILTLFNDRFDCRYIVSCTQLCQRNA